MNDQIIEIRAAEAPDLPALTALLTEAHAYYWGPTDTNDAATSLTADALLSGQSGCLAVLAFIGGVPSGFATITILHPGLSAPGTLFMKDLFVAQTARGTGLGRKMMQHLARMASELRCRRFDWTAETDNPIAVNFYDAIGASRVTEKVYFRFTDDEIRAFGETA